MPSENVRLTAPVTHREDNRTPPLSSFEAVAVVDYARRHPENPLRIRDLKPENSANSEGVLCMRNDTLYAHIGNDFFLVLTPDHSNDGRFQLERSATELISADTREQALETAKIVESARAPSCASFGEPWRNRRCRTGEKAETPREIFSRELERAIGYGIKVTCPDLRMLMIQSNSREEVQRMLITAQSLYTTHTFRVPNTGKYFTLLGFSHADLLRAATQSLNQAFIDQLKRSDRCDVGPAAVLFDVYNNRFIIFNEDLARSHRKP